MLRIYLTGSIFIERDGVLFDERRFNGKQVRLVFALLVAERQRPVMREEIIDELWLNDPPPSCDRNLNSIISRLRSLIDDLDIADIELTTRFGMYQLRLPEDVWVDIESAKAGIDRAESALRNGEYQAAFGWAGAPYYVGRRPFLSGMDGLWACRLRSQLQEIFLRASDVYCACWIENNEPGHAVIHALEAIDREPYREATYQYLMRAYTAAGNRAEALRVYERCRRLLSDELGVSPTQQTEKVYLEILAS